MDFENYPMIFPPPGFIRFDRVGNFSIPGLTPLSPIPATLINIPTQFDGYISVCGVTLSDYSAATYSFYQGGSPIRDYINLGAPIGAPETCQPIYLKLKPDQDFQMYVINTGAGFVAARWRFFGWYYSRQ